MNKPTLFLDVDGVLNGHDRPDGSPYCTIRPTNVAAFNLILRERSPQIVLSSAWRYMVHGRSMKLDGFAYMLHTHGVVPIVNRIVGLTCPDEHCAHCGHRHTRRRGNTLAFDSDGLALCRRCGKHSRRGDQIARWLAENPTEGPYVVLDDLDLGIIAAGHPFVQTDGTAGLTEADAREVIELLATPAERRTA